MKFLQKIFSIKNENYHKIVKVLGFKFKILNPKRMKLEIKNCYSRIETLKNQYNNYNNFNYNYDLYKPHCVDWFGSFKTYALKNNMVEKINALKSGLDSESKSIVDLFLNRVMLLPDCSKHEEFLLSNNIIKSLYTNWEKEVEEKYLQLLPTIKNEFDILGNKFLIETFFFHNGLYFCNGKQKEYLKNKDFIDGGAWIGDSVLIFNKYYKPKKVYSFEISKDLANQYYEIMALNNISKDSYKLVLKGLSDKSSLTKFDDTADSGTSILSTGNSEIELISIDDFDKTRKLNVGFLKIDVEGNAYEALLGATKVIKRDRPIICIAVYHSPHEFFDTKPLLDSIVKDLNYKIEFKQMQYRAYLAIEYVLFAYPAELE